MSVPEAITSDEHPLDPVQEQVMQRVEAGEAIDVELLLALLEVVRAHPEQADRLCKLILAVLMLGRARDNPSEAFPQRFGNYDLLEKIGEGGQGVVFRARQVHVGKVVALKKVNPHDRCRSLRELKIAADLEHEHLVRVYHVGEQHGQLYFTMKLAEKGSLTENMAEYHLQAAPPVAAVERAAIEERKKKIAAFVAKIARAVHYVHGRGVIHRDLKPGNILLDAQGEPLLTDHGLACRIGTGAGERPVSGSGLGGHAAEDPRKTGIVGTPGYMAPEQAQGLTDLTFAVDVYGLGAFLYKLITGRKPFVGSRDEIIAQTADLNLPVPPPSKHSPNVGAGSDLELICLKCLTKEPKDRYASAEKLAEDLERYVRGEPSILRRESWLERGLRTVVVAVNHKLWIPNIARWGTIDLFAAGLNLAVHGTMYALIQTDQPPPLLWLALLASEVVWWWVFLTYLFRHDQIEPVERNLALLWGGITLGSVTLFWLYCPPFGAGRAVNLLAFYPPFTVINGLAFLVVGRLYWGTYYLVGLLHFLVALLMPLWLDLAPLIYAVFAALCMVISAWDHYRSAGQFASSTNENGG